MFGGISDLRRPIYIIKVVANALTPTIRNNHNRKMICSTHISVCDKLDSCQQENDNMTRSKVIMGYRFGTVMVIFIYAKHRLQRKPLVNDTGMHHDTCVTHVP